MTDKAFLFYNVNVNDNQYQLERSDYMPLAMVPLGEERIIDVLKGKEEVKRHLKDLGFLQGQSVQVIGDNTSGLIVQIKGVRIAINRALATKIYVR